MHQSWSILVRTCVFAVLVALSMVLVAPSPRAVQAEENAPSAVPEEVDNMHHFMEYVFEPNYKRLKVRLAVEPADKKAWKAIKGDALSLAEGANLLLLRAPEEEGSAWKQHAVAVRQHGSALFQAARKGDYSVARSEYTTMLNNCNACHKQFADGKFQLTP